MATIFRGPTYAQQQRKAPLGSGWIDPPRLLTALVLLSAVPFKTPEPTQQPQHQSHALSANPDTSRGVPKTLYADAATAFFVQPHFSPNGQSKRGFLNFDASEGTAKVLYADSVAPLFVSPHFAPNAQSKRGFLNFDASEGTPKTLYSDSVTPFFVPPHKAPDRKTPVADTTYDTPLTLLAQGFVQPPLVNAPHLTAPRQNWQPDDTSSGTPKAYYADAVAPQFNPPQIQIDRLRPVADTSQFQIPPAGFVQPPFAQLSWPNAAEYRTEYSAKWDWPLYPEFIPPAVVVVPDQVAPDQGGGGGRKKKRRPVIDDNGHLLDASQAREDAREAIVAKRYPETALTEKPTDDDDDLAFILSL